MSWYRVVDRAHPLWGLEVCGRLVLGTLYRRGSEMLDDAEGFEAIEVTAVRRLDVFVGDRTLQVPEVRGMYLSCKLLELAPFQDDAELSFDSPYGKCHEESVVKIGPFHYLEVALYERAVTVVLRKILTYSEPELLASETFSGKFVMAQVKTAAKSFGDDYIALRDSLVDGSFFAKRGGD